MIYLNLRLYDVKNIILISIIFCFIYACSDEIHQLFSSGRSARIFDVFIDTCGSGFGIILMNYLKNRKCKNEKIN